MYVLIVDDDPELCSLVQRALDKEGHHTRTALSLAEARARLDADPVDLVILDLGLPDGSGLTLCRELREHAAPVPILLLTADGAVTARVQGLDAGADDYVVKPFAVAELRARVRALGRRRERPPAASYRHGEVELDLSARRAFRGGLELALTPREWAVVEALAAADGRVVVRDALLSEVWGEATEAASSSLEVLVARIRRKLGRDIIRTHRGSGYAIG